MYGCMDCCVPVHMERKNIPDTDYVQVGLMDHADGGIIVQYHSTGLLLLLQGVEHVQGIVQGKEALRSVHNTPYNNNNWACRFPSVR